MAAPGYHTPIDLYTHLVLEARGAIDPDVHRKAMKAAMVAYRASGSVPEKQEQRGRAAFNQVARKAIVSTVPGREVPWAICFRSIAEDAP